MKHPALPLGPKQLSMLATQNSPQSKIGLAELAKNTPLDYMPKSLAVCDIGPYGAGKGHAEWISDCMQAYCHALMFVATKKSAHKDKAQEIILAWSTINKAFTNSNAPLEVAWGSPLLVRSIELLQIKIPIFDTYLDKILLPTLLGRYDEIKKWANNWILTILEALIQIYLYKDDQANFKKYVSEFKRIVPSCLLSTGSTTDTDRDCYHPCFALGSAVNIAEMVLHQGEDLYDQRIYKCLEYHAAILTGASKCPWPKKWFTPCVWQIALENYKNRLHQQMPYTEALLNANRPEQLTFCWGPGWLHK